MPSTVLSPSATYRTGSRRSSGSMRPGSFRPPAHAVASRAAARKTAVGSNLARRATASRSPSRRFFQRAAVPGGVREGDGAHGGERHPDLAVRLEVGANGGGIADPAEGVRHRLRHPAVAVESPQALTEPAG